LRSDFFLYGRFTRSFPELVELTAFGGRYELQPPTIDGRAGSGNMIRFPEDAAGLRFERGILTRVEAWDEALLEGGNGQPRNRFPAARTPTFFTVISET